MAEVELRYAFINGFNDIYLIYENETVYDLDNNKFLQIYVDADGYKYVQIVYEQKRYDLRIDELLLEIN